ncbi:farnesol dehydrogenase-like [Haematobia irritans]|uniref:farnesol dehydrogenase-like n=1 Tax=Haematobia irritans TaxID=7368 RepID=UPI003F50CE3D
MEQLKSKIAVVTGASSGIGAAIVKDLLKLQLIVIGLARRIERVEELKQQLTNEEEKQRLHAIRCDVTNATDVVEVFKTITETYGHVQVLVNNAGCLRMGQLCEMATDQIQEVLQTNIMGVVHCTRQAFASMQEAAKASGADVQPAGHVILINSILGHKVPVIPGHVPSLNIYPATKYALTAINEIYRQEFRALGTRIKVTSISPGLVDTELITEEQKKICHGIILQPEDISRAVTFVLTSPPHVTVYELIIKPAGDMI